MKLVLALLAVGMVGSIAHAEAEIYVTRGTSCARVQRFVGNFGAAIVHYGPGIYDRVVTAQSYCMLGEETRPSWIETYDDSACFVGYTCEQDNRGGGGGG